MSRTDWTLLWFGTSRNGNGCASCGGRFQQVRRDAEQLGIRLRNVVYTEHAARLARTRSKGAWEMVILSPDECEQWGVNRPESDPWHGTPKPVAFLLHGTTVVETYDRWGDLEELLVRVTSRVRDVT